MRYVVFPYVIRKLRIETLPVVLLECITYLFAYQTSARPVYPLLIFPQLCNHQIVICITISSPKTSHIQYTRMPSPTYQYVVNLVVSLTIRGGPGVFMNVPVREHPTLNHQIV